MADKAVIVLNGAGQIAKRLEKLGAFGEREIQKVIASTTGLSHEAVVDKITSDIRPHSGMHRDKNPQEVVTDLVDTGAYRQSWQISVEPGRGELFTNSAYALPLEYGTEHMEGFGVLRDTASKMRRVFAKKMRKAVEDLLL